MFSPPQITLKNRPAECPECYHPHPNRIKQLTCSVCGNSAGQRLRSRHFTAPSSGKTPPKKNPESSKATKKGSLSTPENKQHAFHKRVSTIQTPFRPIFPSFMPSNRENQQNLQKSTIERLTNTVERCILIEKISKTCKNL